MRLAFLAPLLLAACATGGGGGASRTPNAEQQAVIDTVDAMFDAMREHDEPKLRSLVAEGAIIVRLGKDEQGETRHAVIPAEAFITGTAGGEAVIDERFTETPTVQLDGDMAALWGAYDVRANGEYMHCGVDAVHLARLGGRWKVTAITYTARKEGCSPP